MAVACLCFLNVDTLIHSFTDAMAKEPCGFIGDTKHTAHLRSAHTLFGSGQKLNGQQPLIQRQVAALHNGASADGELVAAICPLSKVYNCRTIRFPQNFHLTNFQQCARRRAFCAIKCTNHELVQPLHGHSAPGHAWQIASRRGKLSNPPLAHFA